MESLSTLTKQSSFLDEIEESMLFYDKKLFV